MVNAPPSSAPLESGQRGWGFDSRYDQPWSLEPGIWSGLDHFFFALFEIFFLENSILRSELFISVRFINHTEISPSEGKMNCDKKRGSEGCLLRVFGFLVT